MEHPSTRNPRLRILSVGPQSAALARSLGLRLRKTSFASTGTEAIHLLRSKRFELVLCDLELSDMTGIDLLNEMKRRGSDVAFVVTIADAQQLRDALLAMIWGASGYVLLGQSSDENFHSIEHAISRSALTRVLSGKSPRQDSAQTNRADLAQEVGPSLKKNYALRSTSQK